MFICFRAFPYLYAIIPPLLCTIPPNHTTSHLTLSSYLSQMAQAPPLPSSAPPNTHSKARAPAYPGTAAGEPGRFPVPDDKLSWKTDWPEYKPVLYTAPSVLKGPVWADPDLLSPDNTSKIDSFNKIDGKVRFNELIHYKRASLACAARLSDSKCPQSRPACAWSYSI